MSAANTAITPLSTEQMASLLGDICSLADIMGNLASQAAEEAGLTNAAYMCHAIGRLADQVGFLASTPCGFEERPHNLLSELVLPMLQKKDGAA